MSPVIATIVYGCMMLSLFWLDRDRNPRTSWVLWVSVAWLFFAGSRSVAQWFNVGPVTDSIESRTEGNPLDRAVFLALIFVALVVLARRRQTIEFFRANGPIVLFFVFCAASILWSDYPGVAFKRWTKTVGDFAMVLLVLTDRDRLGAIRKLLSRTAYLLMPLSILFIKYYPDLGRGYSPWNGTAYYNGVAMTKNSLGMICLLFGLSALWRLLTDCRMDQWSARRGQVIAQAIVFSMSVWLCWISDSMTSLWCLILGTIVLTATIFLRAARKAWVLHLLVATVILIPFLALFLSVGSDLAHNATARDITTLTDRTEIWKVSLSLVGNPMVGTGFESFWLGSRLQNMWRLYWWHPTQSHNGYLEVFLNLGWIGVVMLAIVIATGYRTVIAAVRRDTPEGKLLLTLFTIAIIYNFTEAAFFRMMTPTSILFLLAITKVPRLDTTTIRSREALVPERPILVKYDAIQNYQPNA